MVHDQRDVLHSDDDRQHERSVAREQLVLSHWWELLNTLAAQETRRRAHAHNRLAGYVPTANPEASDQLRTCFDLGGGQTP